MVSLLEKYWPGVVDQDEISEIVYFAALMLEAQDEKEWIEQVESKLKKANLSSAE